MTEPTNIRQELAARVQDLPAETVKAAVLKWLATEQGDIADLKPHLSLESESNQEQMVYGEIDANLNFTPLTEEEMIAQSLEALNLYQQSGGGSTQSAITNWAASLGTDNSLPCPR